MKKQKNSGKRYLYVFAGILIFAVIFILGIFYWLYGTSRESIVNMWRNNALKMASDTEYYLTRPADAVEFSSLHVEGMMEQGSTNEEIGEYLIHQTGIYSSIVDSNNTGIYGYCRGEYLDGSGWIPEADYEPTERPWYLSAVEAKGELTFVKPYMNLQTFTMMMSVSKMLSDGESVISMDIFLDGMQKMIENLAGSESVDAAIVMDKSGFVVSHSDPEKVGMDFRTDGSPDEKRLTELVLQAEEGNFSLQTAEGSELVFSEHINSGWYTVLVLDERELFGSLQYIYLFSALALILVLLILIGLFFSFHRKHKEAEQLSLEMQAVADIYETMNLVDLKSDTMKLLRSNEEMDHLLGGDLTNYSGRICDLMQRASSDQSREMLVQFMNPATYGERFREINSLSHEFLDDRERWIRVHLIVVDRDNEGKPYHLLWAFESIDEDRKQQEQLREMAEMDAMTKVRNRSNGEARIRMKMSEGEKGMFLLLDADHFKSVNDTFGHDVGDKVIIALAESLRTTFRDSDIVFRLGGDEFAAFAVGVDSEELGERIVDRLFGHIREIRIPEMGDKEISVSVGLTLYPADRNDSFEALYQRADKGMYESKQHEGNFLTFREDDAE